MHSGKKKMPLHIAMSETIHNICKSKKLIHIMNWVFPCHMKKWSMLIMLLHAELLSKLGMVEFLLAHHMLIKYNSWSNG